MARQSFKKRNQRYQLREREEFNHYQKLLHRQRVRVFTEYYPWLRNEDKGKIKYHLDRGIFIDSIFLPLNLGFVPGKQVDLAAARKAYFRICKILRLAGKKKSKPQSNQAILRKTVN